MCVIFHLPKGVMPDINKLETAVYNNWHSYGLVTIVDGKLDIKKEVPKSGEVDPKVVWDLLKKDVEYERFLHLRYNTVGKTSLANAHPFDIYYDPKSGRQVVFMHNGTMYEYKPKKYDSKTNTMITDDDPTESDTKIFVEEVLIPYLTSMDFGNGKGDITHPNAKKLIKKFFPSNNRGVLIASDQPPLFLDMWKELGSGENKYKASNDTYFDVVQRGPEKERRDKKLEQKRRKESSSKIEESILNIEELKNFQLNQKHPFYSLSESPCLIVNDWEVYKREGATTVGYLTNEEIEELYDDKEACITLMNWVFTDYSSLYEEFIDLTKNNKKLAKKLENASLRIEDLVKGRKVG